MSNSIKLTTNQIENISKIIGELLSGSEITAKLNNLKIADNSNQSTKWRRINYIFSELTNRDNSSNSFLRFIQNVLAPESYVNNPELFETTRNEINKLLSFSGIEYSKDGSYNFIKKVTTIDEARQRTNSLITKLRDRNVNPNVLKYCREELLKDNYFHSILEAAKGLADTVRTLSGLSGDGAQLFDTAFSTDNPVIAMNTLKTDAEKNQQKGLAMMLKGVFTMMRNVTAHTPKIKWVINEEDAVKMLMTISFLQDYIDNCFLVPKL